MSIYTTDWFTAHIPVWEHVVIPRLPKPSRWLELGSHEGRSAVWVAEKTGGEVVCVDLWNSKEVEQRFDANTKGRVTKFKGLVSDYLAAAIARKERFDAVYIDADHDGCATLQSAVLSWMVLRTGGILIFDDYRYEVPQKWSIGKIDTHFGIDAFLTAYCLRMRVLHRAAQVICRKEL